jgi:CHASE3 domain sensor protein
MREWFENELRKIDQQIKEYDRWWRRQLIIIIVKGIALIIFAVILVWSIL